MRLEDALTRWMRAGRCWKGWRYEWRRCLIVGEGFLDYPNFSIGCGFFTDKDKSKNVINNGERQGKE